ncbi:hypothetical protein [Flavobacterium marginilacus]|uniref:hypothetical protein n=1 Tax=Flavobacterium marginilacus TaxID=3003256 RepID=UPI0032C3D71A
MLICGGVSFFDNTHRYYMGNRHCSEHIPEYFPAQIGIVCGMVGYLGLGGFFGSIIFSYLLTTTGIWSSSWLFILIF